MEEEVMTLRDPNKGKRFQVGRKVLLEPEMINGQEILLGKYTEIPPDYQPVHGDQREAILITETIKFDDRILLRAGEIFMAPYFILDISYERVSTFHRMSQVWRRGDGRGSGQELIETINQLRRSMSARNEAYLVLEKTNSELIEAKVRLDEHNRELENRVEERTSELRNAQQDLLSLNRDLEEKVRTQVVQLERYNELRRYLSPKLAEKILASEHALETSAKAGQILIGQRTYSLVKGLIEVEELGVVKVKGIHHPIKTYSVLW